MASLVLRYLDVREPLKVVLQLVDARRCLDATLPEADLATLETVAPPALSCRAARGARARADQGRQAVSG